MGAVGCAFTCTDVSFVLSRPESYTDDVELAEGLTDGNGLLVFISWVAERIFLMSMRNITQLWSFYTMRGEKRITLWGAQFCNKCTPFYNCSLAVKWNIFPWI